MKTTTHFILTALLGIMVMFAAFKGLEYIAKLPFDQDNSSTTSESSSEESVTDQIANISHLRFSPDEDIDNLQDLQVTLGRFGAETQKRQQEEGNTIIFVSMDPDDSTATFEATLLLKPNQAPAECLVIASAAGNITKEYYIDQPDTEVALGKSVTLYPGENTFTTSCIINQEPYWRVRTFTLQEGT